MLLLHRPVWNGVQEFPAARREQDLYQSSSTPSQTLPDPLQKLGGRDRNCDGCGGVGTFCDLHCKESARSYAANVFRQAKESLEASANGWQTFLDRVRSMVSRSLEKRAGDRPCAARLALGREVLHELPELQDATVSAEVRQKRFKIAARAMCHNIDLVAELAWEDPGVGKQEVKSHLLNPASVDAGLQQDPAGRICRRTVYVPAAGRVLWLYSSSSPMKPLGVTFLNAISLAGTFHDDGLDCMEPGQEHWLTTVRPSAPK
jgi:hypothetical protein